MADPVGLFKTDAAIGIREDLSNVIYNVAPTETPFISGVPKRRAKNTTVEWQTDTLRAAAQNVTIEGDDVSFDAVVPTVRLNNFLALSDATIIVSTTQNAVDTAGRANELAYQTVKQGKEVKRDMEFMAFDNNPKVARTDTVAGELAGIPTWITSAISLGALGTAPTGDGTDAVTPGTNRALTEALVQGVLETHWTNGGDAENSRMMANAAVRRAISGFDGDSTKFNRAETGRLSTSIRVYESDWGALTIVADRHMGANEIQILDFNFWSVVELQPFMVQDLAKTGHAEKKLLSVEWTIEARNEAANAAVYALTP